MIERNKGKFKPGSGGRPAGARNKLQADFINALADDFKEHGDAVIRIVRAEEPATYLKVIAATLPKEFLISESGPLDDMSDEELEAFIADCRKSHGRPRAKAH
jgi:hypothetical protein